MANPDPIPANYDAVTLNIDPSVLNSSAETLLNLITNINDGLTNISNALSGLSLSWVGTSSSEATQYENEWNTATQALFGTPDDPTTGALNILYGGVASAAANYSANEDNISTMFNTFTSGVSASSSSSSATSTVDQPSDPYGGEYLEHTTAVNETF